MKNERRNHAGKDAAKSSACGDHEIENRKVPEPWFKARELSVANHAADKKADAEKWNLQGRAGIGKVGRKRIGHSRECHCQEPKKKRALIPTRTFKADDEAE